MTVDPFAGLEDEKPLSPSEALGALLESAKRGFAPVRNVLVQRPQGDPKGRPSLLAEFVTNRQERALEALLTLYALQPVLSEEDDALPLGAWANILSTRNRCGLTTASKTFRVLEEMRLVTRKRRGHATVVTPLLEDGSGRAWTKPGASAKDQDPVGYFTIPHAFWTEGYIDRLRLPGKAMLLIMLKETQGKPPFEMAVERAHEWYGISERTAERGYAELNAERLLDIHIQRVASPRLPPGVLRERYHRALRAPFSTADRRALQEAARSSHARPSAGGL
ncbi:hypothetical protein ACIO52_31995 [Nocardia sp. NPDC087230]|uniref:hypothetical protein n=1 Tax=Nocardia sp. NPDC087230 TaxID=3364331 RepID=UPI0037F25E90